MAPKQNYVLQLLIIFRSAYQSQIIPEEEAHSGTMSGRKLNVLLGYDPGDNNFMDPNNQYFVCYLIKKKAGEIKSSDSRLRKAKPLENVGATRCSRRVELMNLNHKKLDEDSIQNIKELWTFAGGWYVFKDDVEDEEKMEEEALAAEQSWGPRLSNK